jgi:hypothetical protein
VDIDERTGKARAINRLRVHADRAAPEI